MKPDNMALQTEIPNNWSAASDNDVCAYIKYLRANCEGCVTASADRNTLYIWNVTIQREYKTNEPLEIYTANGRTFYSTDKNFNDISDLFAHGIASVDEKGKSDTEPDMPRPGVTTAVNKAVRGLLHQHNKKIQYGKYGLLNVTGDADKGVVQKHALTVDGIRLIIEDQQILYIDGNLYPMDAETSAMVQKYLDKHTKKSIRRRNTIWILLILCGGVSITFGVHKCNRFIANSNKKAKAIREYANTLPNYDDSIRLVNPKDEAELQRLFRLREQQHLQIKHFADSINQVKK